ncbi:helix-turn-helix domain-containing protein [Synechococcus sp. PCC 6312]|uniref:helix-turn-helix domain-containing protein n=1 Tax=Synechococcus sp. (strain ATCC 27167 / PCC 6312) TaxID=195253 RepID=UPI00029F069F|nr:helix-turn-helix domain-containing protein [Synechococcus sp. PCC 6312]AFY60114.1 hypothetical protein Syn6312_0907 [Synechococcus sp. PCC 6312]
MKNRKPPSKNEVIRWLKDDQLSLPPLSFKLREVKPTYLSGQGWDFEIETRWDDQIVSFAVGYKPLFTPKAFYAALILCRIGMSKLPKNCYPLVMLPFLSASHLEELEASGISGVDWCGNGVVIVPNKFCVFRSGASNQFATSSPIKNIYRKNTSMVARVFLVLPKFNDLNAIEAEVNRRDVLAQFAGKTPVRMGTISKALKQLEEDLIIERGQNTRLLQADKLLDLLQQNYEPPKSQPIRLKVDCAFDQLPQLISAKVEMKAGPWVATGLSSVSRYASMQREEILSLYCPDARRIQSLLNGRETDRFPNVKLIETTDQPLYFDARPKDGFYWASPVQTWLELMHGDKRDRETADQVRSYILRHTRESQ